MGTHPIFESDFDCLTDKNNEIEQLQSVPRRQFLDSECEKEWWYSMSLSVRL